MKYLYLVSFILLLSASNQQSNGSDKIWMGWIPRESGKSGACQVLGDRGNAFGKYQFDRRYGLVPFMQFCQSYNPSRYAGFTKFIKMGPGSEQLLGNKELAALWTHYCTAYPKEFEGLQDVNGYQAYYVPIKNYLEKNHNIHLDRHSYSVKGSAFSMSIRSGSYSASEKYAGLSDASDDMTILLKTYATYGDKDAGRWTRAGQLGDAIRALEQKTYSEVPQTINDVKPDPEPTPVQIEKMVKALTACNIRSAPVVGDNIIGTYQEGERIKVTKKVNEFYEDDRKRYFTAKPEFVADLMGTCTADQLNVRDRPVDGNVIGSLYNGEVVSILNDITGWYYIRTSSGLKGWASGDFIQPN